MSIPTTTIGAYPKPDSTPMLRAFDVEAGRWRAPAEIHDPGMDSRADGSRALLDRATRDVVREQVELDIDVPTDGEIPREHYIYYHLRHLRGVDFASPAEREMRNGAWTARVPTLAGRIAAGEPFLVRDWRVAQSATSRPVKMTLPGPLTIMDSTADSGGRDGRALALDLAAALNCEVRRLAEAGCRWVQVDEPVFARKPDEALAYGIEALVRCFDGVGPAVAKAVHICCGYPARLDQADYPKADRGAYHRLAEALDDAPIDAVSIEDAHRHNDLGLFDRFARTTVILGLVGIARSRIEDGEAVSARLRAVMDRIDGDRLMVAPDCGLAMLPRELARRKLRVLVEAARSVAA